MPTDQQPLAPTALALDEVLDLTAVKPLAASLLSRRGQDIELDASRVRRLGALCLQVLLAGRALWADDGKLFSFVNASPAFIEGLERLGVAQAA